MTAKDSKCLTTLRCFLPPYKTITTHAFVSLAFVWGRHISKTKTCFEAAAAARWLCREDGVNLRGPSGAKQDLDESRSMSRALVPCGVFLLFWDVANTASSSSIYFVGKYMYMIGIDGFVLGYHHHFF